MKELFLIENWDLCEALRAQGLSVSLFNNQGDAIQELRKRRDRHIPFPECILCDTNDFQSGYQEILRYNKKLLTPLPVILIAENISEKAKKEAFNSGAFDIYENRDEPSNIAFRVNSINDWKQKGARRPLYIGRKIPFVKRAFDLCVASFLILVLSPLFLIIAFLIKVSSKGPVFYYSPRVGTGYKIFPFYKFRSMRSNADHLLKNMQHLNHYANESPVIATTTPNLTTEINLIGDDGVISETAYQAMAATETKQAFVKIKNDPRITKIGHFIRNTSIDELPQLFNVLLGHMSIVGNRPLPLYEAEKLTSDDWTLRFMAPAGITGLWQVTERGKASTSADSRKMLDLEYAKNYSLWMDIKILIKTPFAAFQQENV